MALHWGPTAIVVGALVAGAVVGRVTSAPDDSAASSTTAQQHPVGGSVSEFTSTEPRTPREHSRAAAWTPPEISLDVAGHIECKALRHDLQVTKEFQQLYGLSDRQCAFIHRQARQYADLSLAVESEVASPPTAPDLKHRGGIALQFPTLEPRIAAARDVFEQALAREIDEEITTQILKRSPNAFGLINRFHTDDPQKLKQVTRLRAYTHTRESGEILRILAVARGYEELDRDFLAVETSEQHWQPNGADPFSHLLRFNGDTPERVPASE